MESLKKIREYYFIYMVPLVLGWAYVKKVKNYKVWDVVSNKILYSERII